MPIAIGRSSPAPLLRNSAGARLTVTRRSGKDRPVAAIAPRIRETLSRTAASGKPTTSTRGNCEEMRTSTSTGIPVTPTTAAVHTQATSPAAGGAFADGADGEESEESEESEAEELVEEGMVSGTGRDRVDQMDH